MTAVEKWRLFLCTGPVEFEMDMVMMRMSFLVTGRLVFTGIPNCPVPNNLLNTDLARVFDEPIGDHIALGIVGLTPAGWNENIESPALCMN